MLGDYYPLTPYGIQAGDWIAWQFDRSDLAGGVVQAFPPRPETSRQRGCCASVAWPPPRNMNSPISMAERQSA